MRPVLLALLCIGLAFGQALDPKPKASDYPVHAGAADVEIGAEYMVRSFGGEKMYIAPDNLVVQVALYPLHKRTLRVDARSFRLRVNGRNPEILADSPGMVAASLKYPDWQRRPELVAGAGIGGADVILGRPRQVGRFPGDSRPIENRLPPPPSTGAGGVPRPEAEPVDAAALAVTQALPEGEIRVPVTGYIYFPFQGKLSKVKSVELLYYAGPESSPVVLRLR